MRQHFLSPVEMSFSLLLNSAAFFGCRLLNVGKVNLQVFASIMDKGVYFSLPLLQNPAFSNHP